ncbi:conjugal transfer protein TraI [Pedobacter xixiisoli]|uniref:Conjugal transfer protein TraI n=1 Tax=Pedobacter xixiisoli TaxID=1476464 RepID=A0A286A713_9SPHI|nr:conjugal transfer protein TraI [Pedobacter xixiisoli]SOD17677.1 hypothetical protein SAMN06297358_2632 [Pedobacter xixiisoli]
MKQYIKRVMMAMAFAILLILPTNQAQAGIIGLIKAIVVKAIKAVDIKIQKLQNKTLDLQNAQKKMENEMARQRLNEISEWSKKQKEQYQKYFDELRKVNDVIRDYQRVKDIMQMQWRITNEYGRTWELLKKDGNFSAHELQQMQRVYSGITKQTLQNVKNLRLITTSYTTQMSNAKRMELTNEIGEDVQRNYDDMRRFNATNIQLSLSRAKSRQDIDKIRSLYGINN